MTSSYQPFTVRLDDYINPLVVMPSASVLVYQESSGALLTTLTADANGHIAGSTLSVAANIAVIFNWTGAVSTLVAGKTGWNRQITGANTVTGATNANPIVITTAGAHGQTTGDTVTISGVVGNTAANGTFAITVLSSTTFSIPIAGSGAYTSGGTVVYSPPDVIARPSTGVNLIAFIGLLGEFKPPPSVKAGFVDVYVGLVGELPNHAEYVGRFLPGAGTNYRYSRSFDTDLVVYTVAVSPAGVVETHDLNYAFSFIVPINREALTPVIDKIGSSTETNIALSVTGFTRFALARRCEFATASDFSTGYVSQLIDGMGKPLTNVVNATRPHVTSQPSLNVWIRVSHSSTGVNGPWGPTSNVLPATFQADGGTDPAPGGGSPNPQDFTLAV